MQKILNPKNLFLLLFLGLTMIAQAQKRKLKTSSKALTVKNSKPVTFKKQKKANPADSIIKVLKGNLVLPFEEYQVSMPYGLCSLGAGNRISNPGITFKTSSNARVRSAWNGVISKISKMDDMYVVIVKCGGILFAYSNLAKPFVKENQLVTKGQQLASLAKDETGNYTMDFLLSAARQLNPTDWFDWGKNPQTITKQLK